jgi:hypothetical protein
VLEDLGFSPEEIREIEIKHDLWAPIREEIESRKLTQAKLCKALQIHQPDASLLLRGRNAWGSRSQSMWLPQLSLRNRIVKLGCLCASRRFGARRQSPRLNRWRSETQH